MPDYWAPDGFRYNKTLCRRPRIGTITTVWVMLAMQGRPPHGDPTQHQDRRTTRWSMLDGVFSARSSPQCFRISAILGVYLYKGLSVKSNTRTPCVETCLCWTNPAMWLVVTAARSAALDSFGHWGLRNVAPRVAVCFRWLASVGAKRRDRQRQMV